MDILILLQKMLNDCLLLKRGNKNKRNEKHGVIANSAENENLKLNKIRC